MSFLQPMLLAALPLVALPILIHLINQRRFQTIRWAAMMFLLAANRLSRGYARLRQWLIMFFRMLAIAGLIFAVSRPLASGWLGLTAGGRPDTTIVLLDRSPSMRQQGPNTPGSKLETGRRQLARTLATLGSAHWVLIESTTCVPREMESPELLVSLPSTEPTSTSADLPAMLQAARDYVEANKSGRTEIWICSDIRQNDWNAASGRWQTLRDSFLDFPQGVRFHLLAYPQTAVGNLAVRVTDVHRRQTADGAELLVSVRLVREGKEEAGPTSSDQASKVDASSSERLRIPMQFEIDGARSEVTVEMTSAQFELKDHRIALDRDHQRGWGKVSIPADGNLADNDFYFVFDQPVPRRSVVVTDDAAAARPLHLAAAISPDPNLPSSAEVIAPEQLSAVEWEKVSLLLWLAPLPAGDAAKPVQEFVDRGGQVVFFPPRAAGASETLFAGVKWQSWTEVAENLAASGIAVENWRGDQDLLAHTQSGAALPVGQLQIHRYCGLAGEFTPLAALKNGAPLLARVTTNRGGVYFCTTTPSGDSSLATDGIVLYVFVQRAITVGAKSLGNTRQLIAGDTTGERPLEWQQVAGALESLSTELAFHSGAYRDGDKLLAVNRPATEDHAPVLPDDRVEQLFAGLDFSRVDDQAGNSAALIQEIWRAFLLAMMVALIVEAALCLPRRAPATETTTARGFSRPGVASMDVKEEAYAVR